MDSEFTETEARFSPDVRYLEYASELFPVGLTAMRHRSNYAVSGDGQRFLVLTPPQGARPHPFTVVLNWHADLDSD